MFNHIFCIISKHTYTLCVAYNWGFMGGSKSAPIDYNINYIANKISPLRQTKQIKSLDIDGGQYINIYYTIQPQHGNTLLWCVYTKYAIKPGLASGIHSC